MKLKLVAIAAAAAVTLGTGGTASAHHGSGQYLSLRHCAPGTFQAGVVRFKNVGNNDFNEGARNYVTIRLCSARPHRRIVLTRGRCYGRLISRTGFKNVGDRDRHEGAPTYVGLRLCSRGRTFRRFAISAGYCPAGTRTISAVRFQNVGNNDFNEGARNFVTIRLCRGRWA